MITNDAHEDRGDDDDDDADGEGDEVGATAMYKKSKPNSKHENSCSLESLGAQD